MRIVSRLSPFLFLLFLVACAAAPVVKRYTLEPAAHTPGNRSPVAVNAQQKTLVIAKVTLPGYLNRQPIVHRKGSKILVDDYQLWAEPLMDAAPRILAVNITNGLPEINVVQQVATLQGRPDWKLFIRIERFEAVDDRAVQLDGRWSLVDSKGKTVMSKYMALEEIIPDGKFAGDDLSDVAKSHSQLLAELSEEISKEIRLLAGL